MKKVTSILWVVLFLFYFLSITPSTAPAAVESEPNDSFGSRQILPSGSTTVEGRLDGVDISVFDFSWTGQELTDDSRVIYHHVTDLSAGHFFAWIYTFTDTLRRGISLQRK